MRQKPVTCSIPNPIISIMYKYVSLNTTVFWKIIFQKFAIQKKFTLSLKRQREMINEKTKQNNKRF